MNNKYLDILRRTFRVIAVAGMACAVSFTGQTPASAATPSTNLNPIPPECLNDNGVALTPDLSPGWLFVVNFNVPASGGVRGCLAQANASGQVSRTTFVCLITGNVDITDGSATLKGGGYLSCPFDISGSASGSSVTYNYFWMRAKLKPSVSLAGGSEMPLFVHPSAELRGSRDDFSARMTTRLNNWSFNSVTSGRFAGSVVWLDSDLGTNQIVSHWVNGVLGGSTQYGNGVVFSTAPTTVQIGRMMTGANVILSEIVVDPGGRCCD